MRKILFVGLMILGTMALALSVSGQAAGPSISAGDQLVLDGTVTVSSVTSEGAGFVVIFNDSGRGSPAQPIGSTPVGAGSHENIVVEIDTSLASPTMFAQLHVDDGDEGVFDRTAGADAIVTVDDAPVRAAFSAPLIAASDQFVEENTVTIDVATIGESGWMVIHADNQGAPGPVIGQTQLRAGRTRNVTVELAADGQTDVLWPMLHVDTGEAGVYEFGSVEGADVPVRVNGRVAVLPIWTVPHIRVSDQVVSDSVIAESVLSEGPGFLVIHQEANDTFGGVAGVSDPLPPGLSTDVVVPVDPDLLTSNLWPMLHVDTGTEGEYEFGTVEGADGPVVVNGQVVTFPILASDCVLTVTGQQNANVRANPNTSSTVLRTIAAGERTGASGQTEGGDFVWWQLADGGWIRSDLVEESGACDSLPVVETIGSGAAAPAATEEAGS